MLKTFLLDSSVDDEVILMRHVEFHRSLIKTEMMDLFKDKNILNFKLNVTLIDSRGEPEPGVGVGVEREALSLFFREFYASFTVGREE